MNVCIYLLNTVLFYYFIVLQGGKCALPKELENTLADLLKKMEQMGMGPSVAEFIEIVHDYLVANEVVTKFSDNRPGRDWARNFLKRYNFTLKKGGQMQLARKSVTSDPFVIYGYYETLEEVVKQLGIEDRPECIYNLDETGFPTDPTKVKSIGTKGAKTVRLTHGANRENITVLATCCADGNCLDPLIVFKGKRMQSTWVGENALMETQYAVSESGWMTSSIFEDFFKSFVEKTAGTRPLLLILDGHLSHTSLKTVELALQENITILKLPPHCTDLLQPLDVACFSPLKVQYEKQLNDFMHKTGAREPLRKAAFVDMLCSVWKDGLSTDNVKAGFRATGIVPVDKSKYSVERLDPIKMKTYKRWVNNGKPVDESNNPVLDNDQDQQEQLLSPTPINTAPTASTPCLPQPGCSSWASPVLPSLQPRTSSPQAHSSFTSSPRHGPRNPIEVYRELKSLAPEGMSIFQFVHELECQEKAPRTKSVEEVLQARGRSAEPIQKRRKVVPMTAQVITNVECVEQMKKMSEKKTQTKKRKTTTKRSKAKQARTRKMKDDMETDSTTSLSSVVTDGRNTSSDISLSDLLNPHLSDEDNTAPHLSDEDDTAPHLSDEDSTAPHLSDEDDTAAAATENSNASTGPVVTKDSVNKYVAILYTEPKLKYYWGKIVQTIECDKTNKTTEIKVQFLKQKAIGSNPNDWTWYEPPKAEIEVLDVEYVLYGPLLPSIKNQILTFPDSDAHARLLQYGVDEKVKVSH